MKQAITTCFALVMVPALLAGALTAGQATAPSTAGDGFEFEGQIEALSTATGLRTVITSAPSGAFEPVRAFVVQHASPHAVAFSGLARVRFKPGVLTIVLTDGRAWQFVVERPGVFEPRPPAQALREPVVGIANHQADPRAVSLDRWPLFLLGAGSVEDGLRSLPPGSDGPADCPSDAPSMCAGGGTGATSCSYSCAGTSCSTTCAVGHYACCWCHESALCACCPTGTGH